MLKRMPFRIYLTSLALIFMGSYLYAQTAETGRKTASDILLASLRPSQELLWQRVSPSAEKPDGPVLYQIIFRSSATPNSIPKISNTFTLTNSLISESGSTITINGNVSMSGFQLTAGAAAGKVLTSDASGNGTWQLSPGGGTVTSVATGAGLTGGPITTSGTVSIANGGVTTTQIGSGSALNGQVLTANGSGAVSWQTLTPAITNAWGLTGNSGTGCTTSPCADFLGSIDNVNLEFRVNNQRGYRIESAISATTGTFTPNVIGSFSGNSVTLGVGGATISGGGAASNFNRVTDDFGTIGGGSNNQAGDNTGTTSDKPYATVAGGHGNVASNFAATVSGGAANTASGSTAIVGGGNSNTASGFSAAIAGGQTNTASGDRSMIGGGNGNLASGQYSVIGGGISNTATAVQSIVVGGGSNAAIAANATVSGGLGNIASNTYATVGGGFGNMASGFRATIAGGGRTNDSDSTTGNRALDGFTTVGGGGNNQAGNGSGSVSATVAGGQSNTASGFISVIAGGSNNTANSDYATVGGGFSNTASLYAFVGGGNTNNASGQSAAVAGGGSNTASAFMSTATGGYNNNASGSYSTIAGGQSNTASGSSSFAVGESTTASADNSFALGRHANTNGFIGSFVYGDASNAVDVNATTANQFVVRSVGGAIFYTLSDLSNGVKLFSGGGSWSAISDRNVKEQFAPINYRQLLARVLALPISTWKYKSQPASIRHIGPMAQDFYAAFDVGEDDKHITEIDEGGVALAAIQGLDKKLEDDVQQMQTQLQNKDNQIRTLKADVEQLRQLSQNLLQRLAKMEHRAHSSKLSH